MCDCPKTSPDIIIRKIVVLDGNTGDTMLFDSKSDFEDWMTGEYSPNDIDYQVAQMKFFFLGEEIKMPAVEVTPRFTW